MNKEIFEKRNEVKSLLDSMLELNVTLNKEYSDETQAEYDELKTKYDTQKANLARMEELAMMEAETPEVEVKETPKATKVTKTMVQSFRDSINKAKEDNSNVKFSTKAAISTTTDAGLINKLGSGKMETLKTPGKEFLSKLGVQIHTGLTANLPLPNMGQIDVSIVGEGVANAEFSQAPATVTMTSQRITKKKSFNVEYLQQADDGTLQGILEDMLDMPWRGAVEMLAASLLTDAVDASTVAGAGGYANATYLPQNVPFGKKNPAYVSTYATAGDLKNTARLTNQGPIWEGLYEDGVVDGYKAYSHPAFSATPLAYGDWSHAHVGVWAAPQILIDPLAERDNGRIKFIVEAGMDAAIGDYRAFKYYAGDASIA